MNLYSLKPEAFDDDDINNGQALAAHVGVALAASQNAANLQTAISTRTLIGRAEGILMERFGMRPDQAFAVLRRVSQRRNVRLNRVAEELVRTRGDATLVMQGRDRVSRAPALPRVRAQPERGVSGAGS